MHAARKKALLSKPVPDDKKRRRKREKTFSAQPCVSSWRPPVKLFPPHPPLADRTPGQVDAGDPQERLLPGFCKRRLRLFHAEEHTAGLETLLPVPVAQEPEVAYLHEPVGEDVEKEPPDELGGVEGHDLLFIAVGIILPQKGDPAILHADDAVVGNGDPVGISPEVTKDGLRPVEGRLGVDHPLLRVEASEEGCEVLLGGLKAFLLVGFFQTGEELPSEQPGHHLHGEEEPPLRGDPLPLRQTSSRDDAVEVGMVHEVLSPRVKNGNEPGLHPETLTRKFRERLGGGFEKDVIENFPVSQGKGIELVRQREDDVEVLDGEELFPPGLDPFFFFEELALRAVPVPARVVGYLEVAALLALVDVSPQTCRSADLDGVHGAQVVQGELMGVSVRGAVSAEDVGRLRVVHGKLLCVEGARHAREALRAHVEVDDRGHN